MIVKSVDIIGWARYAAALAILGVVTPIQLHARIDVKTVQFSLDAIF